MSASFKILVVASVNTRTTLSASPASAITSQVVEFGTEAEAEFALQQINNKVSDQNTSRSREGMMMVNSVIAQRLYKQSI